MCGDQLGKSGAGPELVIAKVLEPLELEWEPRAPSQQIPGNPTPELESQTPHRSEPVKAVSPTGPSHDHEEASGDDQKMIVPGPIRSEPVEAAPPTRPSHSREEASGDEQKTIVSGPSFLGLGSAHPSSGGYSYLFQEEEERSHKGLWVFLIVLLALGGVLYAKWQPIRDYVLTTALTHARLRLPRQNATNDQVTTPPSSGPTTTLATADTPLQPTITTDNPPQNQSADQNRPAQKEALPGAGAADGQEAAAKPDANRDASAAQGRSDNALSKPPAKSQSAEQASANDANKESMADEEKPSPKKAARAPQTQANPGSELVTSGEKYLYGRGVARNCDQAVSYFNAAASKQNPQALSQLGALYATGQCVPMNRAIAYAWFRRAYRKEPRNHYFEQNMSMLWREMSPEERQRARERQ